MKINKKFLAPFYPFAGFAVAWYCFMPNFKYLTIGGYYRSQLVIHANFLYDKANYLWRRTTQPKTTIYKKCRFTKMGEYIRQKNELAYYDFITLPDMDTYIDNKCGDRPKEGT